MRYFHYSLFWVEKHWQINAGAKRNVRWTSHKIVARGPGHQRLEVYPPNVDLKRQPIRIEVIDAPFIPHLHQLYACASAGFDADRGPCHLEMHGDQGDEFGVGLAVNVKDGSFAHLAVVLLSMRIRVPRNTRVNPAGRPTRYSICGRPAHGIE